MQFHDAVEIPHRGHGALARAQRATTLTAPGNLVIPVESQVRELDAKLLLSCVAAERGFPVTIGSRSYVNFAMPSMTRGIFLAKSLRSISRLMLNLIDDLGHHVVAWDEESLVRFPSTEYYAWRYSPHTFRVLHHLFAWGEDDAGWFAGYDAYPGTPIHVTGNPRIDLLRPELRGFFAEDVSRLRERHGEFILLNTNFSFVNNFVPSLNLVIGNRRDGTPEVSRTGRGLSDGFAAGMAAHQRMIMQYFGMLIPRLAEWFPDRRIILRPHPSENHRFWKALLARHANVHVLHEGNVAPWLMACKVLIHNGCTTAVEAAVLGTPAITFRPVQSDDYDYHLPNALSHNATTIDAVLARTDEILGGRLSVIDPRVREALFARHLSATSGPLAAERCVDVLQSAGYLDAAPARPPPVRAARAWTVGHLRTLVKRFNMLRRSHRNSSAYHDHRFPAIGADEVNRRIERLGGLLGRFRGVHAVPLSRHLFRITG